MPDLIEPVAALMREAAATAILPRFRRLQAEEVKEKTPGEVVSIADRDAEAIITHGLARLRPGVPVVGEEASAADPALIGRVGEDEVFLVDPLDGTANFVDGKPVFAVMVAHVKAGETVAAWMLDPVNDRLHVAERGAGAYVNGARLRVPAPSARAEDLRGAVLSRFIPDTVKASVAAHRDAFAEILPGMRCSGLEYPAMARGAQHFTLYWRMLPWDHAPGVLFLTEAGGHAARLDGSRYRPSEPVKGLLAATTPEIWRTTRERLLADIP